MKWVGDDGTILVQGRLLPQGFDPAVPAEPSDVPHLTYLVRPDSTRIEIRTEGQIERVVETRDALLVERWHDRTRRLDTLDPATGEIRAVAEGSGFTIHLDARRARMALEVQTQDDVSLWAGAVPTP